MAALIAVGALVVAAIAVGALSLSGSSKKAARPAKHASGHSGALTTSSTAHTTVSVLNGTEKEGVAHRIAAELRFRGYGRAAALAGHPSGATQSTLVEYAPGRRSAAEGVAHVLGMNVVEPLNPEVAQLGNGAEVVVVIGANTAASTP